MAFSSFRLRGSQATWRQPYLAAMRLLLLPLALAEHCEDSALLQVGRRDFPVPLANTEDGSHICRNDRRAALDSHGFTMIYHGFTIINAY